MIIVYHSSDDHDDDETRVPDDWTNHVNYMDFIPDELVLKILSCMTPDQRFVLERVNSRLRRLTISMLHDISLVPQLLKLTGDNRRSAILKYGFLKKLMIKDSDVLCEQFPRSLAVHCPLIQEFGVVSIYGLAFVNAYINSLTSEICPIRKLRVEMRFDTPGAIDLIADIIKHSPQFEETVFLYPARNSLLDLAQCQEQFVAAGVDTNRIRISINPGVDETMRKEVALDDNDFFWDLYENVAA
jgi:hypothetical protein